MPQFLENYTGAPLIVLIQKMIDKSFSDLNTIILARVAAYDQATGRAKVQPLNKVILDIEKPDGEYRSVDIPPIDNVPVMYFGSPRFRLTADILKDDLGLLIACQRSIDEIKAAMKLKSRLKPIAQKNHRKFDINDALFFPCYFGKTDNKFKGMKEKDGQEIGTNDGKMALKGKTINVLDVIDDTNSRVSKVEQSVQAVATSNPMNAGSAPIVLANRLIAQISSALIYARRKISFDQGSYLDLAKKVLEVGKKAVGVLPDGTLANGRLNGSLALLTPEQLAQEMQEEESPPLSIILKHRFVPQKGLFSFTNTAYGWSLPGLSAFNSYFRQEGSGDADFSPFTMFDKRNNTGWSKIVAFVLWNPTGAENTSLNLYWTKNYALSGIKQIRISVTDLYSDDPEPKKIFIGRFIIPDNARLGLIPDSEKSLYSITLENSLEVSNSIQNSYRRQDGIFSSLFGDGNNFYYPMLDIDFFDSEGMPIRQVAPAE